MKYKVVLLLFAIFYIGVRCSSPKEDTYNYDQVKWHPNPNGDSELALAMRAMFDDAYLMKQQILLGKPVTVQMDHDYILTAHGTEPEKVASPEYKAFAQSYLLAIKALSEATPENVEDRYTTIVTSCQSCHQKLCPGPLMRIEKLEFDKGK